MTSRDFCYWLQGYLELTTQAHLTTGQVECVQKHLAMVFKHEIDPSMPNPELEKIHNPKVKVLTKPPFDKGTLLRC